MRYILNTFAGIGLIATVLVAFGLWLDFRNFDRTRGGYEPPFAGVIGDPIDWLSMDRTPTGVAKRGYVVNVLADGTTGMISFEIFKQKIDFRRFSERALAVHKPREAFVEMGFKPEF